MTSNGSAVGKDLAAYARSSLSWYPGVFRKLIMLSIFVNPKTGGTVVSAKIVEPRVRPSAINLRLSVRESPLEDKNASEASASMWIHAGQIVLLTWRFKRTERINCATATGSEPSKPQELQIEPRTTCRRLSNEIRDDSVAYVPSAWMGAP